MLIERSEHNPILKPNRDQSFEAEAVFNGCPVRKGNKIYLVYRAVSSPHYHYIAQKKLSVSEIGIANSRDGYEYKHRRRFVVPEHPWERFGCEDPRITEFEGKYYVFYTALSEYPFRAEGIKIGVAISRDLKKIDEKHLVTPFNSKAMALFPDRINGKIWVVLSANTDRPPAKICLAAVDKIEDLWNQAFWDNWYKDLNNKSLPLQRNLLDQIEVGAPPIKTKAGWLLLYSNIQNYFLGKPVFGIEAALLDLKDPTKIIATSKAPLLTPEEYYEKIGFVPNVVFPSGALLQKDKIQLHYGAADTTCCIAEIDADLLVNKLLRSGELVTAKRSRSNPILLPLKEHAWEEQAVFNPAAIYLEGQVHIVYRAMSNDNTSVFGYAISPDGVKISYRSPEPIYRPRASFEQKLVSGGNSGCEDPRLSQIGDRIYMCYTAFDGMNPPRVALSSISVADFLAQKWNFSDPVLISAPDLDDKDACVFPEKIGEKQQYFIIHRNDNNIVSALSDTLDFDGRTWIEGYRWITPRSGMWDSQKIGIAAPPIKTDEGWVMFYHGVSDHSVYRVGAVLLDLKDPTIVLARTDEPILEPITPYECQGIVANVVFPCGAALIKGKFYLYYGGGDKVIGVATVDKNKLISSLKTEDIE